MCIVDHCSQNGGSPDHDEKPGLDGPGMGVEPGVNGEPGLNGEPGSGYPGRCLDRGLGGRCFDGLGGRCLDGLGGRCLDGLGGRCLDGSGGRVVPGRSEPGPDKDCGGGMGGCWVACQQDHVGQREVEVDSDYGH